MGGSEAECQQLLLLAETWTIVYMLLWNHGRDVQCSYKVIGNSLGYR